MLKQRFYRDSYYKCLTVSGACGCPPPPLPRHPPRFPKALNQPLAKSMKEKCTVETKSSLNALSHNSEREEEGWWWDEKHHSQTDKSFCFKILPLPPSTTTTPPCPTSGRALDERLSTSGLHPSAESVSHGTGSWVRFWPRVLIGPVGRRD